METTSARKDDEVLTKKSVYSLAKTVLIHSRWKGPCDDKKRNYGLRDIFNSVRGAVWLSLSQIIHPFLEGSQSSMLHVSPYTLCRYKI